MSLTLLQAVETRCPSRKDHPQLMNSLSAFALNCSLKPSVEVSSTDKIIGEVLSALESLGVSSSGTVRVADRNIRPGVTSDEGDGDEWPEVRQKILDADIFVLGTPIWMGHPSSHAQRVLERLDAFLGETDPDGRMVPRVTGHRPDCWPAKLPPAWKGIWRDATGRSWCVQARREHAPNVGGTLVRQSSWKGRRSVKRST